MVDMRWEHVAEVLARFKYEQLLSGAINGAGPFTIPWGHLTNDAKAPFVYDMQPEAVALLRVLGPEHKAEVDAAYTKGWRLGFKEGKASPREFDPRNVVLPLPEECDAVNDHVGRDRGGRCVLLSTEHAGLDKNEHIDELANLFTVGSA